MTSKTFKNATNSGTEVYVGEGINADSVQLIIRNVGSGIGKAGIYLNSSDIPALALAILEAAGYSEDDRKVSNPLYATEFASAIIKLADGIEEQERNSEAEADRVALEQEALKLAHAGCEAVGDDSAETLDDMTIKDQKFFLAVARRAREMRAEK